jgi:DNA-binding XRE family transcriptional regulator
MSLDKLSKLSHISKAQISKIERGESEPTLITAYRISRVLNKSVYEVFPER